MTAVWYQMHEEEVWDYWCGINSEITNFSFKLILQQYFIFFLPSIIWNLHLEFPEIVLRHVLGSVQSPSIPKIPSWNSSRLSVCSGLSSFAACSCFQLYFHSTHFTLYLHLMVFMSCTSWLPVSCLCTELKWTWRHNSGHRESQNKTRSFNQRFDPRSSGVNWLLALLTEVFYQSKFLASF